MSNIIVVTTVEYVCPRNPIHQGVIADLGGRKRCSHRSLVYLSSDFWLAFDEISGQNKIDYSCVYPRSSGVRDPRNTEDLIEGIDICYALLPDPHTRSHLEQVE